MYAAPPPSAGGGPPTPGAPPGFWPGPRPPPPPPPPAPEAAPPRSLPRGGVKAPPFAASLQRPDARAHRIPAEEAHERLVHDDRPVRCAGVSRMQTAAGHDPGAEQLVITGADGRHGESALVIALQANGRSAVLLH